MRVLFGSTLGCVCLLLALLVSLAAVHASDKNNDRNKDGSRVKRKRKPFLRATTSPKRPRGGLVGENGKGEQQQEPAVAVERECPYAIGSEEDAVRRMEDTALPGNVVTVEELNFYHAGNHFKSFSLNLALGYCCKSKVVWLPPVDNVIPTGSFREGSAGPRWFDFSKAPDVSGFDSGSCSVDIMWTGLRAFHMHELNDPKHEYHNPELMKCVSRAPRLVGCEAAYYFSKDEDICSAMVNVSPSSSFADWFVGQVPLDQERQDGDVGPHVIEMRDIIVPSEVDVGRKEEGSMPYTEWQEEGGDGNLVIHVRSGEIFDRTILSYYGQPPLQFYLQVMHHAEWNRIDVVTNSPDEGSLNPVIPVLQEKLAAGELPSAVHIHTNRTIGEDLQSMLCADALVLARSTLVHLTGFHSKARRIYGPSECNSSLKRLALQRPETQFYGLNWPRDYSVYENWENTSDQRREMVAYDKIDGFTRC